MRHPSDHFFEHTLPTLTSWCVERGLAAFKAKQLMAWVYGRGVVDPGSMTDMSKGERELLAREMVFVSCDVLADMSGSDGTRKLLVQWRDGGKADARERVVFGGSASGDVGLPVLGSVGASAISDVRPDTKRQTECVMIPSVDPTKERRTACISSQVGCPVGCRFCASGLGGLDGNLSAGRIVEQVWLLRSLPDALGRSARITNVVFMGMGEPLSNFSAVTRAVRTLASAWGMGISGRKITISTVGLPRAIERLAEELDVPVTLALSLHAPTDEIRRTLIPWAEHATIAQLLAACQKWFARTGREITLEYTLLRGVNDRPEHAHELVRVARTLRANVNLIRYNEVDGIEFRRPRTDDVRAFQDILRAGSINTHIRASRGRDIAAACGQLRHETAQRSAAE